MPWWMSRTRKAPEAPKPEPAYPRLLECLRTDRDLNYEIHISEAHGFIYFNNPKVACSSTKASLNLAVAARAGLPLTLSSMEEVHLRTHNPLRSPAHIGLERFEAMMVDPDVFRFSFVRDPVARFCSAYLSKLAPKKRGSGMAQRLWAHLGWPKERELSIEEFGRLCVTDPEVLDFDPHWRLQRRQIGFDIVDYGFIGNQASYAADFAAISRRIFGEEIEVFDTRTRFQRFTRAEKLKGEVPAALRRDIETAFAPDFEMLEEIRARGLDRLPA